MRDFSIRTEIIRIGKGLVPFLPGFRRVFLSRLSRIRTSFYGFTNPWGIIRAPSNPWGIVPGTSYNAPRLGSRPRALRGGGSRMLARVMGVRTLYRAQYLVV